MNAYVFLFLFLSLSLSRIYPFESIRILFRIHMKSVHLAPFILIPVSKSANSASNIPMYVHTMHACLSPLHTNLLTLACQISSGITTLPVVCTTRPWPRVISRMVARSASDFQRARDPLSRATCDINPASVSSLSQTECPRTWGTTIYTSVQYSHRAFVA